MSSVLRARSARRALGLVVCLAISLAVVVPDVSAVAVRRTWSGKLGTNGANGSATLRAYTDGTADLTLNVKALAAKASYTIEFRQGTCSSLGSVITTIFPFTTTSTGTAIVSRNVPGVKMNAIWSYTRTRTSLAFRIGSGSRARCSNLSYPRATRITIGTLGIDLAIIKPPSGYPPCRVAMYQPYLSQPREAGVTMIYAHARTGMFLPLLSRSKINNGASLIGMKVRVYTSDSRIVTYQIDRVRRHVTSIQNAPGITAERLWLYTSEGPNFTYPKLVVEAHRIAVTTTTYAASHPTPRPVAC